MAQIFIFLYFINISNEQFTRHIASELTMDTLARLRNTVRLRSVSRRNRTDSYRIKNNTKIQQKCHEFVANEKNYSQRLIKGRTLFSKFCRIIEKVEEGLNVPATIYENGELFLEAFDAYNEIVIFQETFAVEIEKNIRHPSGLLKVFQSHGLTMKSKYSNYIRRHHKIQKLISEHLMFFRENIDQSGHEDPNMRITFQEELNRPGRWIGTYGLIFKDFYKIAMKHLSILRLSQNYENILNVVQDICDGINDNLILCNVENFPDDLIIDRQGGLLKSGPAHMEKIRKKTVITRLRVIPLKRIVHSYLFLFQKGIIVCREKKNPENSREERFIFIQFISVNQLDLQVLSEDCFYLRNSETNEEIKIIFLETNKHEHKSDASDWIVAITTEVGKYKRMIQQMMGGGDLDKETVEYISSRVSTARPQVKPGKMFSVDSDDACKASPRMSQRISFY